MYLRQRDGGVDYPYSVHQLRRDNPNTSFPRDPSPDLLADWGVFPVQPVSPGHDPIHQIATEGPPELAGGQWRQSWVITAAPPEAEAEAVASLRARISAAIDEHVEDRARTLGYNSAAHCASYVTSTVLPWATEAQAFVAWRDAVWLAAFAHSGAVEAGEAPATIEAALAALPGWGQGA